MNFLCPICDKVMIQVKRDIFFCEQDILYLCNEYRPAVYGNDYLLHYKLYERTAFGKGLNLERWNFVLKSKIFGTLLDYGCGSNSFVSAKPKEIQAFSYDPYFKKDFSFLNEKLDTVTFWDSFEHIARLGIIPLLNSRQLILSLPVLDKNTDLFSWKHFRPGEHVWHFSDYAITNLLERWGYVLKIRSNFETIMGRKDIMSYCFVQKDK